MVPAVLDAQGTAGAVRMRGAVRNESGQPIAAHVYAEATAGPIGNRNQFVGQRLIEIDANKKGEWAIIGLQRGVWLFKATAPDHLPSTLALSIYAVQSTTLPSVPWQLGMQLRPRSALPRDAVGAQAVLAAAEHATAGKRIETFNGLSRVARSELSADVACAAGELALFFNEPEIARAFFEQAITAKPEWYRGHLGFASAALVQTDYDNAGRAYFKARDLAPEELKQALSATVGELQKIMGYR